MPGYHSKDVCKSDGLPSVLHAAPEDEPYRKKIGGKMEYVGVEQMIRQSHVRVLLMQEVRTSEDKHYADKNARENDSYIVTLHIVAPSLRFLN